MKRRERLSLESIYSLQKAALDREADRLRKTVSANRSGLAPAALSVTIHIEREECQRGSEATVAPYLEDAQIQSLYRSPAEVTRSKWEGKV